MPGLKKTIYGLIVLQIGFQKRLSIELSKKSLNDSKYLYLNEIKERFDTAKKDNIKSKIVNK